MIFNFASAQPVDVIQHEVGRRLAQLGWKDPTAAGPGRWYSDVGGQLVLANNYIYRWSKRLRTGVTSGATLQVPVPLNGATRKLIWSLGATAPAIGGPKMNCHGGG